MNKINMSGYHSQTDGLLEKIMARSGIRSALCIYRASLQESTKESLFFSYIGESLVLPRRLC